MEHEFQTEVRSGKIGTRIKVIDFKGDLDVTTLSEVRNILDTLTTEGNYEIIINLCDVRYVDSTIFGILVSKLRQVRHNFGDIKLVKLSSHVYKIFQILGGLRIFKTYETEEEAIEAFKK